MSLRLVCKGISCFPDFAFQWCSWGRRLKMCGDAHDSWYGRACPKAMADTALNALCHNVGLNPEGHLMKWILGWKIAWRWYTPEVWEKWTPERMQNEVNAWTARILQEAR